MIIIGTGAGGGTLAHRLAPSGKRILLLERGGYLPREPENWDSRGGLRQGRYVTERGAGIDKHGGARSARTPQYFVGGNTKFYGGDPVPPARARLRARSSTTAASRPAWPISLRRPRALLHRGRAALPRARRRPARTRPSRRARARSRTRPSRTSRASSSSHDDLARTGHQPFHLPVGVDLDESRPGGRPLRALRPLRRLPLPDRRQGRRARPVRAPGAQARQRHAAHAREGRAARDRRVRRAR